MSEEDGGQRREKREEKSLMRFAGYGLSVSLAYYSIVVWSVVDIIMTAGLVQDRLG